MTQTFPESQVLRFHTLIQVEGVTKSHAEINLRITEIPEVGYSKGYILYSVMPRVWDASP